MARNNRHNTAFVVGSVLGAVTGAAVALWKTPYTGQELRSRLTGGVTGGSGSQQETTRTTVVTPSATTTSVSTGTQGEDRSLKDKLLSGVEKTLAPIVGVELGKTANDSGSSTSVKPMDSGQIKVNADLAESGANQGGTGTAVESDRIGLSLDRVDAEKWAAAYAGTEVPESSETTTTSTSSTSASTTQEQPTRLRQQHTWRGTPDTQATSQPTSHPSSQPTSHQEGTERIGLSLDRVDAEKWASAYGQTFDDSSSTTSTTSTSGSGTTSSSTYRSKAEESAAQTGQGADPAFPGSDIVTHQPVDNRAPDDSIADVDQSGRGRAVQSDLPVQDAATTDQLTKPQVDTVPNAVNATSEQGYHPFPKLGGKE